MAPHSKRSSNMQLMPNWCQSYIHTSNPWRTGDGSGCMLMVQRTKWGAGGVMVGGYGGHIPARGLEFAQPLPVFEMQTNNRGEL